MSDAPASILGFVDVVKDAGLVKASRGDVQTFHGSLINEVIGGATV